MGLPGVRTCAPRVAGGQLAGCPMFTNGSGPVTVTQNGQQTQLDDDIDRLITRTPRSASWAIRSVRTVPTSG
jgi:hypothetical protein